jgi:pyrroloquinoline quinone (PQQ) biosynthesis protein C
MGERSAFAEAVRATLDGCAVSRDNPVHRLLLSGELSRAALREWVRQHSVFHREFGDVLRALAERCPERALRDAAIADARAQRPRLEAWAAVGSALGVPRDELCSAVALPTTRRMLATQMRVAHEVFPAALVGIMVGVYAEADPYMTQRRSAMSERYGLPADALGYFAAQDQATSMQDVVEAAWRHARGERDLTRAVDALRRVLRVRWDYFSGIGRAAGLPARLCPSAP